jgi:hypothetical protein
MESCLFSRNLIQNSSTTQHPGAIYSSKPISISTVNSSKKRKIEELNLETDDDNDGKYCTQYLDA